MTESGRALTAQLLAFGRRQVLDPQVLDVNEVVRRSERLLRRLIGDHIELESRARRRAAARRDRSVRARAGAAEPRPERARRDARRRHDPDHDRARGARRPPTSRPEATRRSRCADDGAGIAEDARDHLFDPFFTTKRQGEGTGLGLSTVYGFVRQCGGTAHVASELGEGTTLTLLLPIATDGAQPDDPPPPPGEPEPGRGETVLVVEDEPFLRELLAAILEEQGYAVLERGLRRRGAPARGRPRRPDRRRAHRPADAGDDRTAARRAAPRAAPGDEGALHVRVRGRRARGRGRRRVVPAEAVRRDRARRRDPARARPVSYAACERGVSATSSPPSSS